MSATPHGKPVRDDCSGGRAARVRHGARRIPLVLALLLTGAATATAAPTSGGSSATTGTWRLLPSAPIDLGGFQGGFWTGREELFTSGDAQAGAAYDPATDGWRLLPAGPKPTGVAQGGDFGVWTGKEMLVSGLANAAFDPATNRWRRLPAPSRFGGFPAVVAWTGSQMIQWGGGCCGEFSAGGSAYTPATNTWRVLPPGPLVGRHDSASAWTGRELVIVGGFADVASGPRNVIAGRAFGDAAAYDPATRSWRRLPPLPVPRSGATAVWTGREVLVVGGSASGKSSGPGLRLARGVFAYRPSTNRWRRLRPMPRGRLNHAVVWTGTRLLVWGGWTRRGRGRVYPRTGLSFDPRSNRWFPVAASPLSGRLRATAVWTGASMIVSGGYPPKAGPALGDASSFTPRDSSR